MLAGFPVVDVKVTLHFGSYHEVDSNENAFKIAASMAFKDGMRKADPVLLEPIMAVEVRTRKKMGDVMGDLSSRRGVIQGMEDMVGGGKNIKAEVPLAEMFGYATQLRSLTQAALPTRWSSSTTQKLRVRLQKLSLLTRRSKINQIT